ncbi:MAG: Rod shape-determining protein MreD [Cyclobacteriaceae bacterium]|jgi:hypothetical protein|nr:Rod shape-determining protein MreD [Cyclobacteriaceae bacterium]
MNKFGTLGVILSSIIILLIQALVLKDMVLYGSAFCFFYILLFLILPIEINPLVQIAIGFAAGLFIDSFYNTQGVHASASTFIMFVRPYWINILSPGSGYGATIRINLRTQRLQWFLTYAYPLILFHSLILFTVEVFEFVDYWSTVKKAFYSSLFTLTIVVIVQYLFYNNSKSQGS